MDVLNIKENQYLIICGEKYRAINMTKFVEKASYWIEYKLQNCINSKYYYLNVETSQKSTLYEITDIKDIDLKMNIDVNGEEFSLIEKGQGKVETYYGLTDIAIGDTSEYFEYISKQNSERVLSVEKWKNDTEISIGRIIKKSNIKILNEYYE